MAVASQIEMEKLADADRHLQVIKLGFCRALTYDSILWFPNCLLFSGTEKLGVVFFFLNFYPQNGFGGCFCSSTKHVLLFPEMEISHITAANST